MFNKQEEKENLKDVEAVIGPNVKVKGKFHSKGNIVIEGELNGSVKSGGYLLIGDQAKIKASIEANEARIGGEINGNIKIKGILQVMGNAQIIGDIECELISIEEGAIFNGKCVMINGLKENKSTKKVAQKSKKTNKEE